MKAEVAPIYLEEGKRLGWSPRPPGVPVDGNPERDKTLIERHAVRLVSDDAGWAEEDGDESNLPLRA